LRHQDRFSARHWVRVGLAFVPLVVIQGYWATYSACVVNGTSFDSIWPPIHVVFTLALLSGLWIPVHRGVRAGKRWAYLISVAVLWITLAGAVSALASAWPAHPSGDSFVGNGATLLTLLLWAPFLAALKRIRPFDERELLALYALMATGVLVMGFGAAHFLIPYIVAPRYFASTSNHWAAQIFPLLPARLFPTNAATAKDFYIGHRTGVPWRIWLGPLTLWTVYVSLVGYVMLGLNGLVRKLWIQQERLTFPQAYLPLEVARQEEGSYLNRFFRNPLMWAGFTVAALMETVAGIHTYFPSTPSFQFRHINLMQGIVAQPWRSIGSLELNIYPCLIGITYLLTLEVSWSSWFFFLVRKLLPVLGYQFGWQDTLTQNGIPFPFPDQESTGAFLAIGILSLWGVWKMCRTARKDRRPLGVAPREIGALVLGITLLFFWMRMMHSSPLVILGFIAAFFLASLAYTRVRAEAGLGGLTGPQPPQDAMIDGFGSRSFSQHDLAGLTAVRWSSWDLRFLPSEMPAQLENYKIGDASGVPESGLFWGMLLAIPVALALSYVVELPIMYYYGANQMNYFRDIQIPNESMNLLSRYISTPKSADTTAISAGMFGFMFTLLLGFLRSRFFSFPFHPVGFAIGFSRRTIEWMWFSIFVGWFFKFLTLRSSGLTGYRRLLPFFLGLILGDFTMAGIFGLLGCFYPQTAGYSVYP